MSFTIAGTSALQYGTVSSKHSAAQETGVMVANPREIIPALGIEISRFHTGYICMIARVRNLHDETEKWYRYDDEQSWREIDPAQLWFWTEEWQEGERRAEEDLTHGNYEDFNNLDDFFDR